MTKADGTTHRLFRLTNSTQLKDDFEIVKVLISTKGNVISKLCIGY